MRFLHQETHENVRFMVCNMLKMIGFKGYNKITKLVHFSENNISQISFRFLVLKTRGNFRVL